MENLILDDQHQSRQLNYAGPFHGNQPAHFRQPFYKDTCHARNHLPASPHRNSEFTSRQHDRTRTQFTSKIQTGQRSSELLLQL